jgi:hypothetical protein
MVMRWLMSPPERQVLIDSVVAVILAITSDLEEVDEGGEQTAVSE